MNVRKVFITIEKFFWIYCCFEVYIVRATILNNILAEIDLT